MAILRIPAYCLQKINECFSRIIVASRLIFAWTRLLVVCRTLDLFQNFYDKFVESLMAI